VPADLGIDVRHLIPDEVGVAWPRLRAAEGIIGPAPEERSRCGYAQIPGKVLHPDRAIRETALIINGRRVRLSASAPDVVVAHVGEAITEAHDPRDLTSSCRDAEEEARPQRDDSRPSRSRRKLRPHRILDSFLSGREVVAIDPLRTMV